MAEEEKFHIKSDSPAVDDLMFWSIVGHESLSRPSAYELRVLSKDGAIDPRKILGHAFDVVMDFQDADGGSHQRHAQGHAVRVVRAAPIGRYFQYHIVLRSWFWLLGKRTNSRIYQEKTVLQVFDAVVESTPLKRFKKTTNDHVIGSHKPRRYCVQHQESDQQFLSRLLEDEGIYYWFDVHDAPGTLHLSDASTVAHSKLPVVDTLRARPWDSGASEARYNELEFFLEAHAADSGKFASRDSDFKAIRTKLSGDKSDPDAHELADLEVFEYPGGYFSGDDSGELARLRMEELAARRQRFHGCTHWPDVATGKCFRYAGDPNGPPVADYLIAACSFISAHPGYEGMEPDPDPLGRMQELGDVLELLARNEAIDAGDADRMEGLRRMIEFNQLGFTGTGTFLITALPADVPFRPRRLAQRATMPGPQTAIVVGPEGKEIHADDFGRVKVQFHWDRYGEEDENSTCWVRVSQPWAGKGWGGYFAPRIGQEVIVDFLNGDPDRPIITGRVYDDDQPIPFASHTQSGFRTRSTPKGSAANCNEFRFEDEKGAEQVYLHAERNQDIEVESDETHWVGHDRAKTIDNDEKVEVKNNRSEKVGVDETIDIGSNRTETVGANEDITIGANRSESVGGDETVTIGANRSHTVGANETRTVGASESVSIAASRTDAVGASLTQTIAAGLTQTVGGAINISSGGPTTFTAAGGFTIIAPGGTKVIDNELCQVGGTIKEGYASKLDFNGMVMELNGAKIEGTISANAMIGLKFEKVGMDIVEHMAAVHQRKLDMLDAGLDIDFVSGKMIL